MPRSHFVPVAAGILLAGLLLTGCAAAAPEPTKEPASAAEPSKTVEPAEPAEPAGAKTYEEVLDKLACDINDPLKKTVMTEFDPVNKYGMSAEGFCKPPLESEPVFLYEGPSEAAAKKYVADGWPETRETDTLYRDGAVVILLVDPRLADMYTGLFGEPVR